jgi:hypothetical protein
MDYTPIAQHTRFLYPFFMARNKVTEAVVALQTLEHHGRDNKTHPIWESIDKPFGPYRQEMLQRVTQFLFSGQPGSCHYLKVNPKTANIWFDKPVHSPAFNLKAALNKQAGIEVFLSHYGVGLLSITLDNKALGDFNELKRFNYRLSQGRDNKIPKLSLPMPKELPKMEQVSPILTAYAPLTARLGKRGGEFTLVELREFLLEPLIENEEVFHFQEIQSQFSVYTVAHFDNTVDFARPTVCEQLKPLLGSLTHLEEPNHPGSLELVNQIMNPCHWAGVGTLGVAHLTAEQQPSPPKSSESYNRVPNVLHKYFIAHLSAIMQRFTLERILDEAASAVRHKGSTTEQQELQALHDNTLDFTVTGYFTEISSREVINQFYRLAQTGLRVPETFQIVQHGLHYIDTKNETKFQHNVAEKLNENINEVTNVQRKMEWFEIFFVSFYAAELSNLFASNFQFPTNYHAISVAGWALFGGFIAFVTLRSNKLMKGKTGGKWLKIFTFLLLTEAIIAWFILGKYYI